MTHEEAKNLKLFQIVRYNITPDLCKGDPDFEWCIPFCGKLAIVTQKVIWPDNEEIHLLFPEKIFNNKVFYDNIDELLKDFEDGHDISFNVGFDISASSISTL